MIFKHASNEPTVNNDYECEVECLFSPEFIDDSNQLFVVAVPRSQRRKSSNHVDVPGKIDINALSGNDLLVNKIVGRRHHA